MRVYILLFFLSFQLWSLEGSSGLFESEKGLKSIDISEKRGFLSAELVDGKLFLKIPVILLDTPLLFVKHHDGYKHIYKQVVWSKFGDQLLLEAPRIRSETGIIIPINNDPLVLKNTLAIFPIIKASSSSELFYIEVTKLFLSNAVDWGLHVNEKVVSDLSYITKIKQFDNEVVIKTSRVTIKNQIKQTATSDFSFFLLPTPMKPRLFDYRMGFFNEDLSNAIHRGRSSPTASIARWRLEKKHKHKDTSVPIKPITFIVSDDIPEKWRPYVAAGILEWLPAFEAAGFKNALEVIEGNSAEDVPINSVNQSMVRFGHKRLVRGFEDNGGSTVSIIIDKRSGEILKCDILIGTSLQFLSDTYFIRCAPMDIRGQKHPFPDDLMGALIQRVVAHEAGHAFGLMDANYGEYAYPFEKMRDEAWLRTMGHTPSIMTYARHNYIVQPEDHVDPSLLIQKVGPNDSYNIKWGYTPFSKDEHRHLERMIRWQDSIPWYRFVNTGHENLGPSTTNEVVDNDDPIKSTIMGLKNMKRVIALIPKVNEDKKDFALMKRLHRKTLELWRNQMLHVLSLVGGYQIHYKSGNQPGEMYPPIAYDIQMEAMDFFIEQAFNPPEWLTHPEYLNKISYTTYPDMIVELQLRLLFKLIAPSRMKRLEYLETIDSYDGISEVFLSKISSGLFKELEQDHVRISAERQEIQSVYINQLCKIVDKERDQLLADKNSLSYTNHSKSLFLNELMSLKTLISKHMNKNMDEQNKGHLKLVLRQMDDF